MSTGKSTTEATVRHFFMPLLRRNEKIDEGGCNLIGENRMQSEALADSITMRSAPRINAPVLCKYPQFKAMIVVQIDP
jgi:hypothetical protein